MNIGDFVRKTDNFPFQRKGIAFSLVIPYAVPHFYGKIKARAFLFQ